jgi:hypothetical protein
VLIALMCSAGIPAAWGGIVLPFTASAGSDFTVDYDGFINNGATIISGLTAQAEFKDFTFTNGAGTHSGQTLVTFNVNLLNNSSAPITASRVSSLEFDTSPNIVDTSDNSITTNPANVFTSVHIGGNTPNVGTVEFCFTDVNCAGGGSGGVTQGNSVKIASSLYFVGSNLTKITFDGFFDRYQSISGPCSNCGGSASGASIPEPSYLLGLFLGVPLLLFLGGRKRRAFQLQ